MLDVRLRSAESADAPALERIARESWHAAYDDILGEETVDEVVNEWYDLDGLRDAAENDDHVLVVATEEGNDGGFAHAGPSSEEDVWNLFRIYVVPDRWGEGIGTALLERIENRLEARAVSFYELAALTENDVGVSFYESRGFERVETEEIELAGMETTQYWYHKEL
jgi:GNAT superfamily N-acetyltransferase